jgi:hypothetical protein
MNRYRNQCSTCSWGQNQASVGQQLASAEQEVGTQVLVLEVAGIPEDSQVESIILLATDLQNRGHRVDRSHPEASGVVGSS